MAIDDEITWDELVDLVKSDDLSRLWAIFAESPNLIRGQSHQQRTLLFYAASSEMANWLVSIGLDVGARDECGWTALHLVENPGVAQVLLDNGASPKIRDTDGRLPLHMCTNVAIARLLCTFMDRVDITDNKGYCPLHNCCDGTVAEVLIENGADVDAVSDDLETPLHTYIATSTAEALIECGASVSAMDKAGKTPLHKCRDSRIAVLLIEHGADVNARDLEGKTPLHYCDDPDVAPLLIKHGADVNARDLEGKAPLHYCDDPDVAPLLIKHGADVNARDLEGKTPLHTCGNYSMVAILIWNSADVNVRNESGQSPIHVHRDEETTRLLIENGADITSIDGRGYTALHGCKSARLAVLLLDNGVPVDALSFQLETPLLSLMHMLVQSKKDIESLAMEEVIAVLLSHGANPQMPDRHGITPFSLVAATNRPRLLRIMDQSALLSQECVPTINDYSRPTQESSDQKSSDSETPDLAEEVHQSILAHGIEPDEHALNEAICSLCHEGRFEEACAVLHDVLAHGVHPDTRAFNTLIEALCKGTQLDQAMAMYQQMNIHGVAPDSDTLYGLIKYLVAGGHTDQVVMLFDRIENIGLDKYIRMFGMLLSMFPEDNTPEWVWSILPELYGDSGARSILVETMRTTRSRRGKLRDIVDMKNALGKAMRKLLDNGYADDALRFAPLVFDNPKKQSTALGTMVVEFVEQGYVEHAWSLIEAMTNQGIKANNATVSRVVQAFAENGNAVKVSELIDWMQKHKVKLTPKTSELLNRAFRHNPQRDDIKSRVLSLQTGKHTKIWDLSGIIDMLAKDGDTGGIWQFIDRAQSSRTKPDSYQCLAIIKVLGNAGLPEDAWKFYELAKEMGVMGNSYVFHQLISVLGDAGLSDRAGEVYYLDMPSMGVAHNSYTAAALIRAYGVAGESEKAIGVLEESPDRDFVPNSYTFAALVEVLTSGGCFERAWEIVQSLPEENRLYGLGELREGIHLDVANGGHATTDLIRTTNNVDLLRFISGLLSGSHVFPLTIVEAAIERIALAESAGLLVLSALARIVATALATIYFRAQPGDLSFEELAKDAVSAICSRNYLEASYLMFSLLAGEGTSMIEGLVQAYADEVLSVFKPIMGSYDSARSTFSDRQLLSRINAFLRAELTNSVIPTSYGWGDHCDLHGCIRDLVSSASNTLVDDCEDTIISTNFTTDNPSSVQVPNACWLLVRPLLRQILNLEIGPVAPLWANSAHKSISITAHNARIDLEIRFRQIDPVHKPEEMIEIIRQEMEGRHFLGEWKPALRYIKNNESDEFGLDLSITMQVCNMLSLDFQGLEPFLDYVAEERKRWLNEGTINPNYYRAANQHFRETRLSASLFKEVHSWVECVQQGLDRQFSSVASWLLTSHGAAGTHIAAPRIVVHDLKKKVQAIYDHIGCGCSLDDEDIERLQRTVAHVRTAITRLVDLQVYEHTFSGIEVGGMINLAIEELTTYASDVGVTLICPKPVYVRTKSYLLASVLSNLLHNATEALKYLKTEKSISISAHRRSEDGMAVVSITNPYNPQAKRSDDSSMLGITEVRHLVERLSDGKLNVTSKPEQGTWCVQLELPIAEN